MKAMFINYDGKLKSVQSTFTLGYRASYFKFAKDDELRVRDYDEVPLLLREMVSDWFCPQISHRHRVRGFSGWYNRGWRQLSGVPNEPFTAHERLEALLLLRDFLSDKLSPEEIESILPR